MRPQALRPLALRLCGSFSSGPLLLCRLQLLLQAYRALALRHKSSYSNRLSLLHLLARLSGCRLGRCQLRSMLSRRLLQRRQVSLLLGPRR